MFAIGAKDAHKSVSDFCAYDNHFEVISNFCIKFSLLLYLQNIQLATIISDMPLWHVCFVLLLFVSFSAYSSVFLAVTFSLLICLSKCCPWLLPFYHFYCFLLSGHFVWWHLCNTSHSLISSTSCLIIEEPRWVHS